MEPTKGHCFRTDYVKKFLNNKHIVIIGDSVVRGIYKDLVLLLQENRLLHNDRTELKAKAEENFMNDRLVFSTERTNSRGFCEAREYQSEDGFHLVQYYFVTRCYYDRIEAIIETFVDEPPDLILMNSCLWDTTRYDDVDDTQYRLNMCSLLSRLKQVLPPQSMFVWLTTLPVHSEISPDGFLTENLQFHQETLRVHILEANYMVSQIVAQHGYDVLDLNYYIRPLIHHRERDGVHWNEIVHRHISELILVFLHDSWGEPLPSEVVEKIKKASGLNCDLRHFVYDKKTQFADSMLDEMDGICFALDNQRKTEAN